MSVQEGIKVVAEGTAQSYLELVSCTKATSREREGVRRRSDRGSGAQSIWAPALQGSATEKIKATLLDLTSRLKLSILFDEIFVKYVSFYKNFLHIVHFS